MPFPYRPSLIQYLWPLTSFVLGHCWFYLRRPCLHSTSSSFFPLLESAALSHLETAMVILVCHSVHPVSRPTLGLHSVRLAASTCSWERGSPSSLWVRHLPASQYPPSSSLFYSHPQRNGTGQALRRETLCISLCFPSSPPSFGIACPLLFCCSSSLEIPWRGPT